MANMIIAGKECEDCIYSTINESNKAKIMVSCSIKNKEYIWGMCIPCEYREVKTVNDRDKNKKRK